MAVDPAGDDRHEAALRADMELRGAGAECVDRDERGIADRYLQGAAWVGGPHAAVLGAERAAAGARRNLGGIGVPGQGEGDVPAMALAVNHHEMSTSARATAPGNACTQRIFRFAVKAPNTPATMTQPRKKILCGSPFAPRARPHISPAARKPLYSPWFAASDFDAAANSGVRPKVRNPRGLSQRNISRIRK